MAWRPAHENHAIERVNFTLAFSELIPGRLWQDYIKDAATKFEAAGFNLLPTPTAPVAPINGPNIQLIIGPMGRGPLNLSPASNRSYVLVEDNVAVAEATLSQQVITFATTRYLGWKQFIEHIKELLSNILTESLKITQPSLLKLEYWDRFTSEGNALNADYSDLLKPNSKHLPSFSYGASDLWHSHLGYFVPHASSKRLVNLNVDVADITMKMSAEDAASPHRSASFYSLAQDTFPSEEALTFDAILSHLDEMHTILKDVLGDVITPKLASQIALFEGRKGD